MPQPYALPGRTAPTTAPHRSPFLLFGAVFLALIGAALFYAIHAGWFVATTSPTPASSVPTGQLAGQSASGPAIADPVLQELLVNFRDATNGVNQAEEDVRRAEMRMSSVGEDLNDAYFTLDVQRLGVARANCDEALRVAAKTNDELNAALALVEQEMQKENHQ